MEVYDSMHSSRCYFFASCVTLVAAMRPDTRISVRALPPRRLPPWMPPVTSPAA